MCGGGRRETCGTPAWGRCPACAAGGVGRGTPARAEAPRVRRPAECLPNARGRPRPRVGGGLREACGTPARTDAPRVAAACGRPAECPREAAERLRGPARTEVPRVRRPAWAAERLREARGMPARAEAPRVRRPAERPRGPMPPTHNAGGTHSASPQTVEQSFARGLPGRGSAGPSARRDRPPANPAACAVNQAS